ncbi:MAG: hypothetical protein QGG40_09995, partial [Myxococcota bacterium]|nr:hypothetical protein [Myxococcota bacterium]
MEEDPEDAEVRVELARALISLGFFHLRGEDYCSRALSLVRKVLRDDPPTPDALVLAGLALMGMGRLEAASKHVRR